MISSTLVLWGLKFVSNIQLLNNIKGNYHFSNYLEKLNIFIDLVNSFLKTSTIENSIKINIDLKSIYLETSPYSKNQYIDFLFTENKSVKTITLSNKKINKTNITYSCNYILTKIINDEEFFHEILISIEKELLRWFVAAEIKILKNNIKKLIYEFLKIHNGDTLIFKFIKNKNILITNYEIKISDDINPCFANHIVLKAKNENFYNSDNMDANEHGIYWILKYDTVLHIGKEQHFYNNSYYNFLLEKLVFKKKSKFLEELKDSIEKYLMSQ